MATIYAPPADLPSVPDFSDFKDEDGRIDFNAHLEAERDWVELVQDAARKAHTGNLVGEIVRFGVADGAAEYVVWKHAPLQLVHLPIGDAWNIPEAHARGLRLADVRALVEQSRRYSEIFGQSKETFRTA